MTQNVYQAVTSPELWIGVVVAAGIAAFAIALRLAPRQRPGDSGAESEAPGRGYRNWVVAASVLGVLDVLAGAVVAGRHGIPWSLPIFALGFGTILTLVTINRRYRHASPTLRRVVELADTALTAALLGGVLIVGNVVAFQYGGWPIDLTSERAFSLSSQTVRVLKGLDRDVTFTLYLAGSRDGGGMTTDATRVKQLLDLYKEANPSRVKLALVHRYSEPEEFEKLIKRVPEVAVTQGGGVIIDYGSGQTAEHVVVRNLDLFEAPQNPFANPTRIETTFKGEDVITSALIRLKEGKRPRIAFLTGHGEPSTEATDPNQPGLGLLRSRLSSTGMDVVVLNLVRDEIAPDTEVLVITGLQRPLQAVEAAKIRAFGDNGGRLLVMLNDRNAEIQEMRSGLEDWLKARNVTFGPGLVVEPRLNLRGNLGLLIVQITGEVRHPIVDALAGTLTLVPNAAPLKVLGGVQSSEPAVDPRFEVTEFLRTSPQSWSETEVKRGATPKREPGKDLPGPLTVGVAVAERLKEGAGPRAGAAGARPVPRLVVFSSRDLAVNPMIAASSEVNLDLVNNAINWLRGRTELLGIAPKTHVAQSLVINPVLRNRLILVPTIMSVVVILGFGISTYLSRRE